MSAGLSVLVVFGATFSGGLYQNELPISETTAAQIDQFLEIGLQPLRHGEQELQASYRSLQRQLGRAPAVEYAYSLALLKRNEYDEAMQVLDRIREENEPIYVPAWRSAIWHRLQHREYERGLALLTEFTEMTLDANSQWGRPDQPGRNALWIGRLLAALDFQLNSGRDWERIQQTWLTTEQAFSGTMRDEFQEGIRQSHAVRISLEQSFSQEREDHADEKAQSLEQKTAALTDETTATAEQQEQLKLTAKEWKVELDRALNEFNQQIRAHQSEYNDLDRTRVGLEKQVTQAQQHLGQVEREMLALTGGTGELVGQQIPVVSPANSMQILMRDHKRLQDQVAAARVDHNRALSELQTVADAGNKILRERQALINEYQQATGDLVKQDKKLERMAKKLAKQQEKLAGETTVRDSTELRRLRSKMGYFSTYLDFDVQRERQRLVDAHSPVLVSDEGR